MSGVGVELVIQIDGFIVIFEFKYLSGLLKMH